MKTFGVFCLALIGAFFQVFVIMFGYNKIIVNLFNVPEITYWYTLGLCILISIFFSSEEKEVLYERLESYALKVTGNIVRYAIALGIFALF